MLLAVYVYRPLAAYALAACCWLPTALCSPPTADRLLRAACHGPPAHGRCWPRYCWQPTAGHLPHTCRWLAHRCARKQAGYGASPSAAPFSASPPRAESGDEPAVVGQRGELRDIIRSIEVADKQREESPQPTGSPKPMGSPKPLRPSQPMFLLLRTSREAPNQSRSNNLNLQLNTAAAHSIRIVVRRSQDE